MIRGCLRAFCALLFIFMSMQSASAQEYFLSTSDLQAEPGKAVTVKVTILNVSNSPIVAPATLEAYWRNEGRDYPVTMASNDSRAVAPDGFTQVLYSLVVPSKFVVGPTHLYLEGSNSQLLVNLDYTGLAENDDPLPDVTVSDKEALTAKVSTVISEIADQLPDQSLQPSLLDGLKPYEPIYFLAGFGPLDAKFQISLKYQLFNEKGRWGIANPWLRGFHLGYSQVSFWDLARESKPFEDTNFKPEIFYGLEDLKFRFLPAGDSVDLQAGFLHESNGRDQGSSRSLNTMYLRVGYQKQFEGKWFAKLSGDFWRYVGSLKDNPDIVDFRGHSSFRLTAGHEEALQLSAYRRGRIGRGKSSYLFDLTVPLTRPGVTKSLNFNLHAQLFTGYGENLLTYDQKETRLRVGLGIYR